MMTKKNIICSLLILLVFSCPLLAKPNSSKGMYISVEKIAAKNKPSFWGRKGDIFYYGDLVQITGEKGSWRQVSSSTSGKSGWVKESVLTSRKIVAKNKVNVDADEIALAGKGFSTPLEAEYSKQYDIDFDVVDKIENVNISEESLKDFIVEGNLAGGEE